MTDYLSRVIGDRKCNGIGELVSCDNAKYVIETNIKGDGLIEQVVMFKQSDIIKEITRNVINTQEKQTMDALISLGWTPPIND